MSVATSDLEISSQSQLAPRLSYSELLDKVSWVQGEHITAIGPTGAGKTTLCLNLLTQRDYVVVLAAKPRDPLISELREQGYQVFRSWPPPEPRDLFSHIVFWPHIERMKQQGQQRRAFALAMAEMYEQGGWACYLDEARYVLQFLGLAPISEVLWQQGRTQRISFVVGAQRPFWIPLSAYDQATHLFVWRDNDEKSIARFAEFSTLDKGEMRLVMESLDRHDFLYMNTRTGDNYVSNVRK